MSEVDELPIERGDERKRLKNQNGTVTNDHFFHGCLHLSRRKTISNRSINLERGRRNSSNARTMVARVYEWKFPKQKIWSPEMNHENLRYKI